MSASRWPGVGRVVAGGVLAGALPLGAWAESITIPVYGVLSPAALDPAAAAALQAQQPQLFMTLQLGQVTAPIAAGTQASQMAAISACGLAHAQLTATGHLQGGTYVIAALAASDVDTQTVLGGALTTTVLAQAPAAPWLALAATPAPPAVLAYAISGSQVVSVVLGSGFVFPSAADAQAFRLLGGVSRVRGTISAGVLSAGGAQLIAVGQAQSSALAAYPGAVVQLRDTLTGQYRYCTQDAILLDDATRYDPVAEDGQLLLGGSSSAAASPGQARCRYVLNQVLCTGTVALAATMPASALPPSLAAAAQASELAPAAAAGPTTINTSQSRGPVPVLDDQGQPTGATVAFYATTPTTPAPSQSTVQVLQDIDQQRANAVAAAPTDTMTAGAQPDRITTPSRGAGASGVNQLQAQAQSTTWSYPTTVSASDVQTTLDQPPGVAASPAAAPTPAPATASTTLSAAALLALSDQSLDDEVATTYSAQGVARPAQAPPQVTDAQGTLSQAQAAATASAPDVYHAVDRINQVMAPHLEDTAWPGGLPPHHHQALIHPIDYLDQDLMQRYSAATGVTIPDQLGDPVPGDGANPLQPVPLGCAAGHPFYDLDGDGSLDRWFSDDPYHGGYQQVRLLWAEQPGGTYQLGDFTVAPAYNVCLVGIKAPLPTASGSYGAHEDLLLTIGHDYKPFSHAVLHRLSYQTFYGSGLISALDPQSTSDPTLYRFALRNTTTLGASAPPAADGLSAAALVPTAVSGVLSNQLPPGAVGPATATLTYVVDWYDQLTSLVQGPGWTPGWSQAGFVLPAGVVDHALAPAVVHETWTGSDGTVLASLTVSRPQDADPAGGEGGSFDPSLLPLAPAPLPPTQVLTDTYQWDYPQGSPTAAGGMVPADPAAWQMPWNLAWSDDPHSRNQSTQGFALNSANLQLFPAYAASTPLITHAGLLAAASAAGAATASVEWLLREVPAGDPAPGQDPALWRDGQELFTTPGWSPPAPWLTPGRAPYHVPWDARSDAYGQDPTAIGAVLQPSGERLFDVAGGVCQYTFRGCTYACTTVAEQLALLKRMWNYDLTGYEVPPANTTTLPSLYLPQHLDNADPTSPWLNQCVLPPATTAPALSADATDADHGGGLSGSLVADLQGPTSPRLRVQVQRRARLMQQQVFVFSAARGREWELQMARRMPASVQLWCVEYDDREAVKAVLGSADVRFPTITDTTITDSQGVAQTVETSNELQLLGVLASQWFDAQAPVVSLADGRATVGTDASLHSSTVGSGTSATSGTATTIDQAAVAAYPGFAVMLPDGLPAAQADAAVVLRSPPAAASQWQPDPGQAALANYVIEFRHPMLLVYQDQASAIYVHYGRNCDPDTVFGHWDDCAASPAPLPITSAELQRRVRFDGWATPTTLGAIWDAQHPAAVQDAAAATLPQPPAPPDPGPEPQPPALVADPGPEPQAPVLELRSWDPPSPPTYAVVDADPLPAALDGYGPDLPWAPWNGDPAYLGLDPQAQWSQYLGDAPEFDLSSVGWLRVPYSQQDGGGVAVAAPALWSGTAGDAYDPIGPPETDCSSLLYGSIPQAVHATSTHSDNTLTFFTLHNGITPGAQVAATSWTSSAGVTIPAGATLLVASNDASGSGEMWYVAGHSVASYATISHPMTTTWYQAWAVAPIVADEQAILEERQSELDAYSAAEAAFSAQEAAWQQQASSYADAMAAASVYPAADAAWQDAEAAWTQWQAAVAGQASAQAQATAAAASRAAWIAQVLAQLQAQPVSWSGDPGLTQSTLAQLQALAQGLGTPIWQAYAWFCDPANGVSAATTPASPGAAP